jgi:glycosyltransferase involved in cell wall biosynthesis
MIKISVIICSHNPREEHIRRTLQALRIQTLPASEWELLVIDNASQSPLSERLDISWHPDSRHLQEPKLGKLNAWLLGMRQARSDILLFVDDDNVLAPDYLEQALALGAEWPFVGAWGGSILPEYEKPLPEWVGDQVWRITVVEVKEDVWSNLREDLVNFPVGAGLCIRRQVAQKYVERCESNSVSAMLDRSGKGLGGYGDIDLVYCALDLGLGKGKSPRLRLTHLIPSNRLTLDYFVCHSESDAASMMLFRASRGLPVEEPRPIGLIESLRWLVHRLIHRIPREQYEISKAHHRGLQKGWEMAQTILSNSKSFSPKF